MPKSKTVDQADIRMKIAEIVAEINAFPESEEDIEFVHDLDLRDDEINQTDAERVVRIWNELFRRGH